MKTNLLVIAAMLATATAQAGSVWSVSVNGGFGNSCAPAWRPACAPVIYSAPVVASTFVSVAAPGVAIVAAAPAPVYAPVVTAPACVGPVCAPGRYAIPGSVAAVGYVPGLPTLYYPEIVDTWGYSPGVSFSFGWSSGSRFCGGPSFARWGGGGHGGGRGGGHHGRR